MSANWQFKDAFGITVGQQKNRFTFERMVSSHYPNYTESSMLTNMFALEYTPAFQSLRAEISF